MISINMQQDNIVNNVYSISFSPLTVSETSVVWQTVLKCIQLGNNYINLNFYFNSGGEPVAVEPSQPNILESPDSPDTTSDHNSAELNYFKISPPSPIPIPDDSMKNSLNICIYFLLKISCLIQQTQLSPQLTNQKTPFLTFLQFQHNFHFMLAFILNLISNLRSFVNTSFSLAIPYASGFNSWILIKKKITLEPDNPNFFTFFS